MQNNGVRLLTLLDILEQDSDEEHPISTKELIGRFASRGLTIDAKTLYRNIQTLNDFGVDVRSRRRKPSGWYIGERRFELAELKLLVDAVQSCKFIPRKKSDELIRKLEKLTSRPLAGQLQRQVYVDRRVKTMNNNIYRNIDVLHSAINSARKISFRYFDYNVNKEKEYHHGGRRYSVSPYGLIWNSENYYLVALDEKNRDIRHYRVDRMDDIIVSEEPRTSSGAYRDFDMAAYSNKHFGMYSGEERQVRMRFSNSFAGVVLDRFGHDETMLIPDGPDHFTLSLPIVVSPQFFGWLFGLGDGVQILSPEDVASQFKQELQKVLSRY